MKLKDVNAGGLLKMGSRFRGNDGKEEKGMTARKKKE